ncbi:MAG: hypothetical protein WCA17_07455 [Burkholderiales bacterium]
MKLLIGLLVLLLAACAQLVPRDRELSGVDEIVAAAVVAAGASVSKQQNAVDRAREAFQRDPSAVNRLRLATFLAALPAPRGDAKEAYSLLEPFVGGGVKSPSANFAALLAGQVADRLRLTRESEQAIGERQRLARTAQQHDADMREEFERSRRAAAEREAKLQEQLEALKSIERGIVEREEKLRNIRR